MTKTAKSMRLMAVLFAVIAYSLLAHFTLLSERNAPIGALIALAPIVLTLVLIAWQSKYRWLGFTILLLISPLFWFAWHFLVAHYEWIYWLQHESLQVLLLFTFARTLTAGQQPLCTQFADIVQGPLSPELTEYTRKITIVWSAFFAGVILISSYLFFGVSTLAWSIFANLLYLPLLVLMFIVEYWVRLRAVPNERRSNFMDAIHAFMNRS